MQSFLKFMINTICHIVEFWKWYVQKMCLSYLILSMQNVSDWTRKVPCSLAVCYKS
jgi:hypothetical protein